MGKKKIKAETVITSHMNADFDAVASMLAAQKIYPEAVVLFPGSQEKNLKDFFISSMSYLFNMADAGTIDFSKVKRLVIVDTRQEDRLKPVAGLLNKEGMEIHIYDHHPALENDIRGKVEDIRQTGATVTILSKIIQERKILITPDEATVMALGIYEDTGSFTYASTTEQDFQMAAFLLSSGANLNTISNLVTKEISPDQITWINDLLNEMTCHKINGYDINVSTISSPDWITDLAAIVQKVVKIENLDVFFSIALMGNKVQIIARSRVPQVDVGKILSTLGGGGHPFAASATISNIPLAQIEQQLIDTIQQTVKVSLVAKELMSSPAITIESRISCKEAATTMARYNINALLVLEPGTHHILGYTTRTVMDKVLYHKLEDLDVKEYMTTEISTISPRADIREIEAKIIGGKQRLLPVIENDALLGVVTRTDLLNFLVQDNKDARNFQKGAEIYEHHTRKRNVKRLLDERLSKQEVALLRKIGAAGDKLGINLFVVGGFVRDLLLYRKVDDMDIVVEGDGISFAKSFALMCKGRCNSHKKFGTAVVVLPDGFKVDVASARREYYKFPAALPTVEMSSIKLDMFRRDFTINTMAIQLNQEKFGTLIDFFGAQRDLKDKTIRTIHNLSFVEDPTRVFRAIKFANRFDFTIGKLTSNLIQNAVRVDFFKNLSGLRVFSELRQILEEDDPIPAIKTLETYGLERVIHPYLAFDNQTVVLLEEVKKALAWHDLLFLDTPYLRWSIYFMVMIRLCSPKIVQEIADRLKFSPTHQRIILNDRIKAEQRLEILEANPPKSNSRLHSILKTFRTELILYMMACAKKDETRKALSLFYTKLRDIKVLIRGEHLITLGVRPGPEFKRIMSSVLKARLDHQVATLENEIDFAKGYIRQNKIVD
ncbi:polyA polymerase family protein (tRNA nucleotidyltransferase) (tRNA CCA-pyrophosphorylase) [Desulforapulum autotrophicum HRM2]|uniref:PolyA polymerase family protein (tRNA nucleotidyltransferase) (tRNA CCA-pyrophosphorylase) n=1 Tax=Desulforapulum autotrophicum (strain ATCC 43914 / DSM 3382 / VKM B-1955 / HRM2) TaxID=177437 RepID=C0QEI7_DESAH|nr:CBS domain-containing protein [Desulforapulum autotrophicum]ACN15329.1 polyA polymerase family protein (tRNA nucleotidyltransferase) (tRNA CCA-pyrophosphorylase) [Desulforapulum autotrophicum HRM2]